MPVNVVDMASGQPVELCPGPARHEWSGRLVLRESGRLACSGPKPRHCPYGRGVRVPRNTSWKARLGDWADDDALTNPDARTNVHSVRTAVGLLTASGCGRVGRGQHLEQVATAKGGGKLLERHLTIAVAPSECIREGFDRK